MIELLLVLSLMFGSGYGTRYMTEPVKVCKEIIVEVPELYLESENFHVCKEGIDPITGKDETCMISTPRFVLTLDDHEEYATYIQGQREWLRGCTIAVDDYNDDKFILR